MGKMLCYVRWRGTNVLWAFLIFWLFSYWNIFALEAKACKFIFFLKKYTVERINFKMRMLLRFLSAFGNQVNLSAAIVSPFCRIDRSGSEVIFSVFFFLSSSNSLFPESLSGKKRFLCRKVRRRRRRRRRRKLGKKPWLRDCISTSFSIWLIVLVVGKLWFWRFAASIVSLPPFTEATVWWFFLWKRSAYYQSDYYYNSFPIHSLPPFSQAISAKKGLKK